MSNTISVDTDCWKLFIALQLLNNKNFFVKRIFLFQNVCNNYFPLTTVLVKTLNRVPLGKVIKPLFAPWLPPLKSLHCRSSKIILNLHLPSFKKQLTFGNVNALYIVKLRSWELNRNSYQKLLIFFKNLRCYAAKQTKSKLQLIVSSLNFKQM